MGTKKESISKFIAIHKNFINRGWGVGGVFGMGLVIANTIQTILHDHGISFSLYVIYPFGVFSIWFLGIIEYWLKIPHQEQKFYWNMINRNMTEIKKENISKK